MIYESDSQGEVGNIGCKNNLANFNRVLINFENELIA
jgi:hypothetical protein